MKQAKLSPQFDEFIPEKLEPGILYVSMQHVTLTHLCACGCGREVVTPLSPTDWSLCYDGVSLTLDPSIGNWSFPCRSHYFIRKNKIVWARDMSQLEIERGRRLDRQAKANYYGEKGETGADSHSVAVQGEEKTMPRAVLPPISAGGVVTKKGLWTSILSRLGWH